MDNHTCSSNFQPRSINSVVALGDLNNSFRSFYSNHNVLANTLILSGTDEANNYGKQSDHKKNWQLIFRLFS